MATELERLVIALQVQDQGVKAELARITAEARKTGQQGAEAMQPFDSALKRSAAEVRAGIKPLGDYRAELQNQKAELEKLAASQDKNSGEYRKTLTELEKVGSELTVVNSALKAQESLLDRLGGNITRFGGALSIGVTVPLMAAGAAALSAAVKLGDYASSLLSLQAATGLSTDTLQEFEHVARNAGTSSGALAGAAEGLTRRLRASGEESATFSASVQRLGVSLRDANGNLRSTDSLMPELIGKLGQIENVTERNAVAMQVFGRRASELTPVMELGADGFERLRREAHDLGLVLDGDALKAADDFRAQWETLRAEFGAVSKEIAMAVMPAVSSLVGTVRADVMPLLRDWADRLSKVADWWGSLDTVTQRAIMTMGGIAVALGPALAVLGQATRAVSALRTAIVALRAAGLLMSGPTGWVIAGVAALGALAVALSGRSDSLDSRIEKVTRALASEDPKSLHGALGRVTDDLRPGSALRQELEGFRDELERTGEVGEEMSERIVEALRKVPLEAAEAQVELAKAAVTAARMMASSSSTMTPDEALGPLKDRVAALGRADLSEHLMWRADLPNGGAFSFPEGFTPKGISSEVATVIADATRAVRGEGDAQVARVQAAEAALREAITNRDRLLAGPTSTDGAPDSPSNSPVPSPTTVENDADEIIGIINNLNAELAELERQRGEATTGDELQRLNTLIEQKRAELLYWQEYNRNELTVSPTAAIPGRVDLAEPSATAGLPDAQPLGVSAEAAVADFELSLKDLQALRDSAWASFYAANSEEARGRAWELKEHYEGLIADYMRPWTPVPLAGEVATALLPDPVSLLQSGPSASVGPHVELGIPAALAQLDDTSAAYVAKVRGDLSEAMDFAAQKAAALGESFQLPREQMNLTREAIVAMLANGLEPSHPAVIALTEDFLRMGEVLENVADQEARLKAFQEAVAFAKGALGELPGPLEQNISTLQEYRDSLDMSADGASILADEIDRLIAALKELQSIEDSGLRSFAADVDALAGTLPGLGGLFARSTAQFAEGLHKIAETDDKLEGTALVIRGMATAIEGITEAAKDGGLNGNEVMELIGGIASVAGEAIGALSGIPGLGPVVSAAFQLITAAVGDLGDGLAEIQEQVDETVKTTPLLARETVDAFAAEYTQRVSRGGIAGSFGATKAELDEEAYNAAVDLAGSFVTAYATALTAADFEASMDLGFDRMIRDQLAEAFVLTPEIQAQIQAMVDLWKSIWEDGQLTDEELADWNAARDKLIADGQATRAQMAEMGLLDDSTSKAPRATGSRVTELTGPARDHFTDLLAPLRHLGAQLSTQQEIRNLLRDRLPNGNNNTGHAQSIHIDQVTLEGITNPQALWDELSRIATRRNRGT